MNSRQLVIMQSKLIFLKPFSLLTRISRNHWISFFSNIDREITLRNEISGEILKYPSVWLRDNCQCSDCFEYESHSRLINLQSLDVNVHPLTHEILRSKNGEFALRVEWSDNHKSIFNYSWLKDRSFTRDAQTKWLRHFYMEEKIPWSSADYSDIIKKYDFDSVIHRETELLKFLSNVDVYGVTIIENAGCDKGQLEKLAECIGFLKRTYYGKYYTVEAKPLAKNAAYLPKPLQLHTDLPYYDYCPGVNILHYLIQPESENEGENQLVDGLYACNVLKKNHPEFYRTLRETTVEWSDIGEDAGYKFHSIHRGPVICENADGNIVRINFSQPQRDSHFCVSINEANEWYKAMKEFISILHSEESYVRLKMRQGDMLVFDNIRVLHGRGEISTERHVLGGYLDWDIFRSKIRVLKSKYRAFDI